MCPPVSEWSLSHRHIAKYSWKIFHSINTWAAPQDIKCGPHVVHKPHVTDPEPHVEHIIVFIHPLLYSELY
jgi:hypothetical protein